MTTRFASQACTAVVAGFLMATAAAPAAAQDLGLMLRLAQAQPGAAVVAVHWQLKRGMRPAIVVAPTAVPAATPAAHSEPAPSGSARADRAPAVPATAVAVALAARVAR
jgi:hypothetical protein